MGQRTMALQMPSGTTRSPTASVFQWTKRSLSSRVMPILLRISIMQSKRTGQLWLGWLSTTRLTPGLSRPALVEAERFGAGASMDLANSGAGGPDRGGALEFRFFTGG